MRSRKAFKFVFQICIGVTCIQYRDNRKDEIKEPVPDIRARKYIIPACVDKSDRFNLQIIVNYLIYFS